MRFNLITRIRQWTVLSSAGVLLSGCQSTCPAPDVTGGERSGAAAYTDAGNAWDPSFTPPLNLDTPRVHLEPLGPEHADMDYEAFMSSRQHLRDTLHWGSWPGDDTTVEDNVEDLTRHRAEFTAREAYAYTVLDPDRSRALGCIYLNPVEDDLRAARFGYWVVAEEIPGGLDAHLQDAVLNWIAVRWPLDTVYLPLHVGNIRGIEVATARGLKTTGEISDQRQTFVWQR